MHLLDHVPRNPTESRRGQFSTATCRPLPLSLLLWRRLWQPTVGLSGRTGRLIPLPQTCAAIRRRPPLATSSTRPERLYQRIHPCRLTLENPQLTDEIVFSSGTTCLGYRIVYLKQNTAIHDTTNKMGIATATLCPNSRGVPDMIAG